MAGRCLSGIDHSERSRGEVSAQDGVKAEGQAGQKLSCWQTAAGEDWGAKQLGALKWVQHLSRNWRHMPKSLRMPKPSMRWRQTGWSMAS